MMRVIGTAGHVDHGKSTLVEALTGTHPDRLKEEQEREMTIDLGFAWLTELPGLPPGEEVGVIDVPGHRDFIENMLAGVGGVDAALLVIAADEGVMPQTREHLAILDLLGIPGGVVAITKVDLIRDPDWLDLVEEEVRQVIAGTTLERAPVVRVSGRSGAGLEALTRALGSALAERPARPDLGRPRLPIDRVFSISGFGTVVTGTLLDGRFRVGEEVAILPRGLTGRIRGLQSHQRKMEDALPGSRTAINISGVGTDELRRGDVVARPGTYRPTRRIDVHMRLLPDTRHPIRHNMEVKFFLGAAEVMARLRLLGTRAIDPGEAGWLQLELTEPAVARRGDRFILRRPSPGQTLGGGVVVDAHPARRHRRFSEPLIDRLESLLGGNPADVLLHAALARGPAPLQEVVARAHLEEQSAAEALQALVAREHLIALEEGALTPQADTLVAARSVWSDLTARVVRMVESYHRAHPLRRGLPKEELRSRLRVSARMMNAVLDNMSVEGAILDLGSVVAAPEHEIAFSPSQRKAVERLLGDFEARPGAPPTVKESVAVVGEAVYAALVETGVLIPVSPEVVFRREDYERIVTRTREMLEAENTVSVAQVRDALETTRRYALALLEHLDERGITVREGDYRRLSAGAGRQNASSVGADG